ncbi:MAG TPA: PilZ domain-containing protein [Vitreimonas sp.]|uniref:PilZ domain-containing protein n=1 Tax=Vitreimonas sp. TaxID=3069702 RepID=UPI002D72FF3E|nr:PilZ domain-containing protein [Vitreimonas sp.]HYD86207.1 PilZ domain-containing protein [Vitreimonas sp.]
MSNTAEKIDFAAAARRLTASQVGLRERRRFRRMPIEVNGRMLDTLGREHDCRTADISPGDVRIAAPTLPRVGERVVLYLDGIGRVSGNVARTCGEGEVAIIFDFTAHKREKLAEQLTLAANRSLGIEEPVRGPIRDGAQTVRLAFETGESYDGEVLDFSLAGMTIRSQRPPPLIGVWVRAGAVYGRVARLIEGGFAIDFAPQKPTAPPP